MVILTYPACNKEYKAALSEDLQTLGKALARKGTYKQVADAAFRRLSLRNCLIKKKTLEALRREYSDLCSKNKPSLLHKSGSDDMENFSLQKLSKELKERGPLFIFPHDMCNSKGERL